MDYRNLPRPPVPEPEIAITRDEISALVDTFYDRVWADDRLGPIFSARLDHNRDAHLDRMKLFWASVLLRSGEYHGRPVPKHKALSEVEPSDFVRWLTLFETTAHEILDTNTALHVIEKAERIAESLWLAMFGTIGQTPPAWLKGQNYETKYAESQT